MRFRLDTETALIRPGRLIPPLVCTVARGEGHEAGLYDHRESVSVLADALDQGLTLVGHNIAYDLAVLCVEEPALLPRVFEAYAQDRVTDTMLRQKLLDNARGKLGGFYYEKEGQIKQVQWTYGLDALGERLLKVKLEKGTHQLRFGPLRFIPKSQWPADMVAYAAGDLSTTELLDAKQQERAEDLVDEYRQARAAWATQLMSAWGWHTCPRAIDAFEASIRGDYEAAVALCQQHGLVRKNGKRDTKAARQRMLDQCAAMGIEPKRTKTYEEVMAKIGKGQAITPRQEKDSKSPLYGVSLDEEACLDTGDEVLEAYSKVSSLMTVITKNVEYLRKGVDHPIQAGFDTILSTGRMSCKGYSDKSPANGYQQHNVTRLPGLRECFVPREGCWFLSADYDGLELRTVAQICLKVVGYSKLARFLNEGADAHCELATHLMSGRLVWQEVKALVDEGDPVAKAARQFAKPGNFGFWGGMGALTFMKYARQPKNGRIKKTLDECKTLKNHWKAAWDEAGPYLRWIGQLTECGEATITQFGSGRKRGGLNYSACANTFFQGLGADATKEAFFEISRECYTDRGTALYGCRIVNYVHDEFILEVPASIERANEAADRLEVVMREAAGRWLPDVTPTASAVLSTCWSKNAKTVRNEKGQLIPWTPETAQ